MVTPVLCRETVRGPRREALRRAVRGQEGCSRSFEGAACSRSQGQPSKVRAAWGHHPDPGAVDPRVRTRHGRVQTEEEADRGLLQEGTDENVRSQSRISSRSGRCFSPVRFSVRRCRSLTKA